MCIPRSSARILFVLLSLTALTLTPVFAEDRSFYSPIIFIDKEKNQILISTSGKVFYIEISEAAKPHIDKLPQGVLADFVVEMRGDDRPLLKKWHVTGADSECRIFDGTKCK
ncbi:MAG: hypothetical protein EWM72_03315 [Nitrospira sp.]|nr:MAG: hypothetical protein EWM72_03315 [Nitrospira sp.]